MNENTAKKRFAHNLNRLMRLRGVSQAKLARDLGESEARLSYYRNGKAVPRLDMAHRLAEYFEVPMEDLVSSIRTRRREPAPT